MADAEDPLEHSMAHPMAQQEPQEQSRPQPEVLALGERAPEWAGAAPKEFVRVAALAAKAVQGSTADAAASACSARLPTAGVAVECAARQGRALPSAALLALFLWPVPQAGPLHGIPCGLLCALPLLRQARGALRQERQVPPLPAQIR